MSCFFITNTLLTLLWHNTDTKREKELQVKLFFIIIFVLITTLVADSGNDLSMDAQIAKIKSASPKDRVRMMNAFKVRVSQMNMQERSLAIKKMQAKMCRKNVNLPEQTHVVQMQAHDNINMKNVQDMNQKQVASQMKESWMMQEKKPMNIKYPNMEKMKK